MIIFKILKIYHGMIFSYIVYGRFIERYKRFKGFWGLALRGAFGAALRSITCRYNYDDCKSCPLYRECIYARLFESSSFIKPSARIAAISGKEGVTNPYTLYPLYSDGEKIMFQLNVFGEACSHENALIVAIMGTGIEGIGYDVNKATRRRFMVEKIEKYIPSSKEKYPIYKIDTGYRYIEYKGEKNLLDVFNEEAKKIAEDKPREIVLLFRGPYKISENGIYTFKPSFKAIIMSLSRKYSMLAEYHDAGIPFSVYEAKRMRMLSEKIKLTHYIIGKTITIRKTDIKGNTKNFGEFASHGVLTYKIPDEIWRSDESITLFKLLLLGEYLHIGKLPTTGCGKYEVFKR